MTDAEQREAARQFVNRWMGKGKEDEDGRSYWIDLSQSRRLPLLQVVSNNKSSSVGVQSPTEINAPRGCAVILRRICQLSLTRITHQVSRAFDLNDECFGNG